MMSLPRFFLLAVLLSSFYLEESLSIRVLRNTLPIGESVGVGGAKLVNVSDNVVIQDISICIKFNLKVDGYESLLYSRALAKAFIWTTLNGSDGNIIALN